MHDVVEVRQLKIELEEILSQLDLRVKLIGQELTRPGKLNLALITMKTNEITALSHKFTLFLPSVAAKRNDFIQENGPLTTKQAHDWSQMTARIFQVRTWINDWPKIENVLRKQVPQTRSKLYRKPEKTEAITTSQMAISDAIFDDLHLILNDKSQDDSARDHGCFADISLPHSLFIQHVHAAHRVLLAKGLRHPTRFLDVGCGAGMKVLSAARFFARADGLEFDPGYVAAAQRLFDKAATGTCHVIEADGLTYEDYDDYDVIYFYRPMRHVEKLRQLEEQIVTTARPGTLIIAPYLMFDGIYKELGCARIDDRLYMTQASQSQASALRKKAEMTGVSVVRQTQYANSLWAPILSASEARGFSFSNNIHGYSTVH